RRSRCSAPILRHARRRRHDSERTDGVAACSASGAASAEASPVSLALLIDFGSTYTKLRALDLASGDIAASAQGPSTVTSDVNVGLDAAMAALARVLGGTPRFAHRLACSSAAGGLRMVTVGLVKELTAEAAR